MVGPLGGVVTRSLWVDRGDLPDRAGAVAQTPDEEAVDADQLARPRAVDVRFADWLA